MSTDQIKNILNQNYKLNTNKLELQAHGGEFSYVVSDGQARFFLKVIRQPFIKDALYSLDIQMYLKEAQFPVIPIILTKDYAPFVKSKIDDRERAFILYKYIEGARVAPENTEKVGQLFANLHNHMARYRGSLTPRNKFYFIERYLNIIEKMKYDKLKEFKSYGNELWERIKNLPTGYCHLNLNRGNILEDKAGGLYIMDFDKSGHAFPMYDIALFCDDTDYFKFDSDGYHSSKARLNLFLKGYLKDRSLGNDEIAAFFDLIALNHFQLQTSKIHAYDSFNSDFLDKQLDWLKRWREQTAKMG